MLPWGCCPAACSQGGVCVCVCGGGVFATCPGPATWQPCGVTRFAYHVNRRQDQRTGGPAHLVISPPHINSIGSGSGGLQLDTTTSTSSTTTRPGQRDRGTHTHTQVEENSSDIYLSSSPDHPPGDHTPGAPTGPPYPWGGLCSQESVGYCG